jgi:hypothetical protein
MRRTLSLAITTALLAGYPAVASAQNIVSNPGFETGDFTGWTEFGPANACQGVDNFNPRSGTYSAFFCTTGTISGIFQNLTTTPGQEYVFAYFIANSVSGAPGGPRNSIEVYWDGNPVQFIFDVAASGYIGYSFNVFATSNMTEIAFEMRNDAGFFDLDDVSVEAMRNDVIPEPMTMILLGTGLAGIGLVRRRRNALKA